jgi:hypothetical protein
VGDRLFLPLHEVLSPRRELLLAQLFRQQAETARELRLCRERRRAAVLATMGVDYPYTYEGAPFPASAFEAAGAVAA